MSDALYRVTSLYGDNRAHQYINAPIAKSLITAKKKVIAALELEEIYHALIDDYIEFESSVLSAGTEYSVRPKSSATMFDRWRRVFNRRLMHVLTLARSYIYGTDRAIAAITSDDAFPTRTLQSSKALQYDSLLGYRVMEALRNSAQHFGFPLHGLSLGGTWVTNGTGHKDRMHIYAIPTFTTEELRRDPTFNKRVLRELEQKGLKHDVRSFLREYLVGLSGVHSDFQSTTQATLSATEDAILAAINSLLPSNEAQQKDRGLLLSEMNPDGEIVETQLFSELIERRRELAAQNGTLVHLGRAFVSGSADFKV